MTSEREQQIRQRFLDEADEYLIHLEQGVLGLRASLQGQDRQNLDALLRTAHSLKGGSGMMGLMVLSQLAHLLEDSLKVLQVRGLGVFDETIETWLLQAVDELKQILQYNRQGEAWEESWLEVHPLKAFPQLQTHLGTIDPEEEMQLLREEQDGNLAALLFETEVQESLDGLEIYLAQGDPSALAAHFEGLVTELMGLGEMLELPAFVQLCQDIQHQWEGDPDRRGPIARAALEQWRHSQALILVGQTDLLPDRLGGASLPPIPEEPPLPLSPPEEKTMGSTMANWQGPASQQSLRIPLKTLDRLGDLFGEITIERNGLALQLQNLRQLVDLLRQRLLHLQRYNQQLRTLYDGTPQRRTVAAGSGDRGMIDLLAQFDSLELDQFGDLHLLSQAMMENIVQLEEVSGDITLSLEDTERTGRELTRTTRQMQEAITQVRMRPLGDLLAAFPRAIRDWNVAYGKQVNLHLQGETTLIDRTILEALNEPLLHLLRNAFDHGIEGPDIRQQAGKPPQGRIEISAGYRGNRTWIQVRDDGGGIALEKVRQRAIAMGLSASDLAQVSERELLDLIFEPGFSTVDQVGDLSGRGVGMDVVRSKLQEVGGTVTVQTRPQQGTTFTLTVPFNLSIMRVLVVEVRGLLLAFPTNAIAEILLLSSLQVFPSGDQTVIDWDGSLLPLVACGDLLPFAHPPSALIADQTPLIDQGTVLLLNWGDQLVAVAVDRYWFEQEVTIRQVEGEIALPQGFAGCTILGDGRVLPLVDPQGLMERWEQIGAAPPILSPVIAEDTSDQNPCVLIVDDSVNVRRFLVFTLEKAGYQVEQAKDGLEALEILQQRHHIKAVICDIEMPRLDGYGFLARLRSQDRQLPVMMLTSRSGEKHRQMATYLGANAYFSKPFREQELLQTLGQWIQSHSPSSPPPT